jgi:hypothetical protein
LVTPRTLRRCGWRRLGSRWESMAGGIEMGLQDCDRVARVAGQPAYCSFVSSVPLSCSHTRGWLSSALPLLTLSLSANVHVPFISTPPLLTTLLNRLFFSPCPPISFPSNHHRRTPQSWLTTA